MKSHRDRHARRGISGGAVAALLVGAVILLALGFALGRQPAREASEPSIDPERLAESIAAKLNGRAAPSPAMDAQAIADAVARGVRTVLAESSLRNTPADRGAAGEFDFPGEQFPAADSDAEVDRGPAPFRFVPDVLDFGIVEPGIEMRGTVRVENVSDKPLRILGMRPDCRCTTMEDLSGTTIAPHESVELNAVVEGRPTTGPMHSQVRFVFSEYGAAALDIRGEVTRAVNSDPTHLAANDQTYGDYALTAIDDQPFRVLAVNGGPPVFADGFDPARDEPRTSYRLSWELGQYDAETCVDANGDWMPRWWVVETDHPKAPIVELQIRHSPCTRREVPLRGRHWVLAETHVVLGELVAGQPTEFEIDLKPFKVDAVSDRLQKVQSETPEQFDAELKSARQVDDKVRALVRVTPVLSHRGLLYGVARVYGEQPDHSEGFVVIGRVVGPEERRPVASDQ